MSGGTPSRRAAHSRRSLRVTLSGAVVALTACGLLVAGGAGLLGLRAYLVHRTDDQLRAAARLVIERQGLLQSGEAGEWAALRAAVAPTDYVVELRRDGGPVRRITGGADLPVGTLLAGAQAPTGGVGDVRSVGRARHHYRAVAVREGRVTVAVGLPAAPIRDAVRRLALIEALTAAAVLLAVGFGSRLLVGRALRPLEAVTATATAIAVHGPPALAAAPAAVPDAPPPTGTGRTETERLSLAVDGMLTRIRAALAERDRSQQRLRDFVADASHELRTPLTTVRGYLQLVGMDDAVPEDRRELLARADREAGRMASLVDDLLYLARIDAGRTLAGGVATGGGAIGDRPADRGTVDLAELVRDCVADALAVQPGRPLHLSAPPSLTVPGDAAALRRVVANLLANVRAHTPPHAQAWVSLTPADAAGPPVARLEVRDDGPGMPAGFADRATERFTRAAPSSTSGTSGTSGLAGTDGGGSGLGLAIAAGVVAAHGGTLRVTSPTGPRGGTSVTVDLPA